MRPPEAAVARARDIFGCIRFRVVVAMIGHPRHWFTGRVEHGEEYENILNHAIQPQRAVSKAPVIADGCSHTAD
jgi:hypothetical protein